MLAAKLVRLDTAWSATPQPRRLATRATSCQGAGNCSLLPGTARARQLAPGSNGAPATWRHSRRRRRDQRECSGRRHPPSRTPIRRPPRHHSWIGNRTGQRLVVIRPATTLTRRYVLRQGFLTIRASVRGDDRARTSPPLLLSSYQGRPAVLL